mmetsp:Transcript_36708/g.57362  ORF Transcript_36708/g.57362 Transcript_36708/m.57362 type:complete len:98 (+) Transcript_36708:814-1107(+)
MTRVMVCVLALPPASRAKAREAEKQEAHQQKQEQGDDDDPHDPTPREANVHGVCFQLSGKNACYSRIERSSQPQLDHPVHSAKGYTTLQDSDQSLAF